MQRDACNNVLVHPKVRETLRSWSVASCISALPREVEPFVRAGYIACLSRTQTVAS